MELNRSTDAALVGLIALDIALGCPIERRRDLENAVRALTHTEVSAYIRPERLSVVKRGRQAVGEKGALRRN